MEDMKNETEFGKIKLFNWALKSISEFVIHFYLLHMLFWCRI